MAVDLGSAIAYLMLDTNNFNTSLQGAQSKLASAGASMASIGSTLTATVTKGLVSVGKSALNTTMEFESAMSQVQATMGIATDHMSSLNGAAVNTMDSLGDLAKQLGASTKFSANEAAAAINNMAMAGYDVQQIYDSLPTVLSLASAGALDLDYATQLVANGLNVMGLETSDATELADKLAVTASNAYGSVSDFGEGLLKAGGQAKLANVSLTDTMTALGILGDNGISAAEGGTMLRNTLKNLYTPTSDAAKALEELGVVTKDKVTGELRDFQDVLKDLGGALDNLTEAERIEMMGRIFDTRTIAGANALIAASGERWDELSSAIDGAGGAADKMAKTQLANLKGQLTILKSSLEGLLLSIGEILMPAIQKIVGFIQKVVDWLNNLDESQKKMIVRIALVVAALGPVLLIGGRILGLIGSLKGSLGGLLTVGGKIKVIIAIVAALAAAFMHLYNTSDEFREKVQEALGRLKEAFSKFKDAAVAAFEKLKEPVEKLIEKISGPLLNVVTAFIESFAGIMDAVGPALDSLTDAIGTLIDNIPLDSILDSIGSIIESIGKLVSNVLPALISVIVEIVGWLEPVFEIVDKIFSAVADIVEQVRPFIEEITGMISEIIGDLPIEDFLNAISDLVTSILSIVSDVLPVILSILEKFMPVLKLIGGSLKPIIETLTNLISLVANLLSGNWEAAGENFKGIFVGIWHSIQNVWETIKATFAAIGEILAPVFEAIGEFFSGVWDSIVSFFEGIGESISSFVTETIPQFIEDVGEWFKQLPEKIGYWIGQAFQKIVNFGEDAYNWITTSLPNIINGIVNWFKQLPGKIWTWLKNAVQKVSDWVTETYNAAVTGIQNVVTGIVDRVKQIPGKIKEWWNKAVDFLKSVDLKAIGEKIINSLWSGLKSMWDSVSKWFSGIGESISGFFGGIGKGFNAGRASVGAYATGLDYVPRDMEVTVHRGERILTQEENKKYNEGGSIEITNYQNNLGMSEVSSKLDKLIEAFENFEGFDMLVDGKKLVGSIRKEINKQLAEEYAYSS